MLTLITAPSVEPITLAEAKLHAKVDLSADDSVFVGLIETVRQRCETATNRALCTQTWDLVMDRFPMEPFIEVPLPPLQSVTSVTYRDTAGTSQTWAASNYVVTNSQTPPVLNPRQPRGRISLAYGIVWPDTYGQAGGDVTVRFVCGYGDDSQVPYAFKAALLMDLTRLYAYRAAVVSGGVAKVPGSTDDLYWSFRSHPTQRAAA